MQSNDLFRWIKAALSWKSDEPAMTGETRAGPREIAVGRVAMPAWLVHLSARRKKKGGPDGTALPCSR